MNRIFASIIVTLALGGQVFASEQDPFPLLGLPDDVIVHTSGFMEPQAAVRLIRTNKRMRGLQARIIQKAIPNIYKFYNLDPSKIFIHFDDPRWNLDDKLPLIIKDLAHEWYLRGLKIIPPFERFCHMMAAGRAGHQPAAIEAGHMLMNHAVDLIPIRLTMDDLVKVVPKMDKADAQEWDLCKLEEPLIDDPSIRTLYTSMKNRTFAEQASRQASLGFRKTLEDAITADEKCIENIKQIFKETLEQCETVPIENQEELAVFKSGIQFNLNDIGCYMALMTVEDSLRLLRILPGFNVDNPNFKLSQNMREFLRYLPAYGEALVDHMKLKLTKLERPDVRAFCRVNGYYTSTPLYWAFLADFHQEQKNPEQELICAQQLRQLRLRGANSRSIADLLYSMNPLPEVVFPHPVLPDDFDPEKLKAVEMVAKPLLIMSSLLGDTNYGGNLTRDNGYHILLIKDKFKAQAACEFYQQWHPMTAFALQLQQLRNPDNPEIFGAISTFYHLIKYDSVNGTSGVINGARSISANELNEQMLEAARALNH